MKKYVLSLLVSFVSLCYVYCQDVNKKEDPDFGLWNIDTVLEQLQQDDIAWKPIFDGSNVLAGMYRLKAGDEDHQKPHKTDEIYYVISGKGKFDVDGKKMDIEKGSTLFVKANVHHHFYDIEEELVLLVFFDK